MPPKTEPKTEPKTKAEDVEVPETEDIDTPEQDEISPEIDLDWEDCGPNEQEEREIQGYARQLLLAAVSGSGAVLSADPGPVVARVFRLAETFQNSAAQRMDEAIDADEAAEE